MKLRGGIGLRFGAPCGASDQNRPPRSTGNVFRLKSSRKSGVVLFTDDVSHSLIFKSRGLPRPLRTLRPPKVGCVRVQLPSGIRPTDKSANCNPKTTESTKLLAAS